MTNKFKGRVPAWPATSMLTRLGACRSMLYLHGFLTDAESDRVHARLIKAAKKAASAPAAPPTTTGGMK